MTGKFTITTGSGSRKSERIHMKIQIRDNNINFLIVRKDHTEKKILTSEDNSDNVLKRNVLPFDKRMKKDVTQKQREMFGRPLAIADAE